MATRTIATRIVLDGEREFSREMSRVNSSLGLTKSEIKLLEEEFRGQANTTEFLTKKSKLLRDEQDQQTVKVKALEQAVLDAAQAYGETDKRTDGYRRQLINARRDLTKLNNELQDNDRYLREAQGSASQCARSIDGFGREVKDTSDDLGGLVSKLSDFKGAIVGGAVTGAVLGGASQLIGQINQVVEASEEYRKIMGTLEVSSEMAGYTTEETAQAYNRLYDVLGDTQTAATTVANLQAIGLTQEQLMMVVDSAVGGWAKYGDSIPIDGLAEAINETIQAGKVTGTFADVLNWAGVNEDKFNERLDACKGKTERANLVMRQMADQGLAEAGQAWRDTNSDIVAANDSQRRFEEAQATLGESLSPVRDALRDVATEGFLFLADAINRVLEAWDDLGGWAGLNERVKAIRDYDNGIASSASAEISTANVITQGLGPVATPVTTAELQNSLSAAVSAIGNSAATSAVYHAEVPLVVNGRELARATISDFRAIGKSNPEVVSDT